MFTIKNEDSLKLKGIPKNYIDCLITDPPYGISFHGYDWDKQLPPKKIWENTLKVLKPGGFGVVFSSIRLMHRIMVDLEDSGFIIKDVLFWANLNGMPKSRNVGLNIDTELGFSSDVVGQYKYVQGYKKEGATDYYAQKNKNILSPASSLGKKYNGAGNGIKPSYEPIILVQKPLEKGLNVAQNIIKHGTGALNLEETRIPYGEDDKKVGHNPHPKGRVSPNILRTEQFQDSYDKFFMVPKVRQKKEDFNIHPTIKPIDLMNHLVKLVSFEGQRVLDPFMGSGSTGVSAVSLKRSFYGYELEKEYFDIAKKRIELKSVAFIKEGEFSEKDVCEIDTLNIKTL